MWSALLDCCMSRNSGCTHYSLSPRVDCSTLVVSLAISCNLGMSPICCPHYYGCTLCSGPPSSPPPFIQCVWLRCGPEVLLLLVGSGITLQNCSKRSWPGEWTTTMGWDMTRQSLSNLLKGYLPTLHMYTLFSHVYYSEGGGGLGVRVSSTRHAVIIL